LTAVDLNGLPYIAISIERLMRIIESDAGGDGRSFHGQSVIPTGPMFRQVCKAELLELMGEYRRMTAYIEQIPDSWTRELFQQRFLQRKSFRELGMLRGMPSGTVKHEIYSYIARHPEGYMSSRELADKWELNVNTVNAYCRRGLLAGAFKTQRGHLWMIPRDAELPVPVRRYKPPKLPADFMTTGELARKRGVSPGWISKQCQQGNFPGAIKLRNGKWAIPRQHGQTKNSRKA
jgi:hypothetical protein